MLEMVALLAEVRERKEAVVRVVVQEVMFNDAIDTSESDCALERDWEV